VGVSRPALDVPTRVGSASEPLDGERRVEGDNRRRQIVPALSALDWLRSQIVHSRSHETLRICSIEFNCKVHEFVLCVVDPREESCPSF
jgi:hypothetical protein